MARASLTPTPPLLYAHTCEVCGAARMRLRRDGWYECAAGCGHRWLPIDKLLEELARPAKKGGRG